MRRLVVDALKKDGYEVSEAPDGGLLLVAITAHYAHPEAEVDLIISDVRMPICGSSSTCAARSGMCRSSS
jgi:CheY-like chemotaxis protein